MIIPTLIYGILAVALLLFLLWEVTTIKISSYRAVWGRCVWSVLAILMGVLTILNAKNLNTAIGGVFIIAFLLVLAGWRPGLANWGILVSLRKIQSYQLFTRYEVSSSNNGLLEIRFFSGDVQMQSVKTKATKKIVEQFLKDKIHDHNQDR